MDTSAVPVDHCVLEPCLDTPEEVRAVPRPVERDRVVPEQSSKHIAAVGGRTEHVPAGPGDVPELEEGRLLGQPLANHRRCEREVVILEPDGEPFGVCVPGHLDHRLGELLVHGPVRRPEPRVTADVTEQ